MRTPIGSPMVWALRPKRGSPTDPQGVEQNLQNRTKPAFPLQIAQQTRGVLRIETATLHIPQNRKRPNVLMIYNQPSQCQQPPVRLPVEASWECSSARSVSTAGLWCTSSRGLAGFLAAPLSG